jgi:hypothetical protein
MIPLAIFILDHGSSRGRRRSGSLAARSSDWKTGGIRRTWRRGANAKVEILGKHWMTREFAWDVVVVERISVGSIVGGRVNLVQTSWCEIQRYRCDVPLQHSPCSGFDGLHRDNGFVLYREAEL